MNFKCSGVLFIFSTLSLIFWTFFCKVVVFLFNVTSRLFVCSSKAIFSRLSFIYFLYLHGSCLLFKPYLPLLPFLQNYVFVLQYHLSTVIRFFQSCYLAFSHNLPFIVLTHHSCCFSIKIIFHVLFYFSAANIFFFNIIFHILFLISKLYITILCIILKLLLLEYRKDVGNPNILVPVSWDSVIGYQGFLNRKPF